MSFDAVPFSHAANSTGVYVVRPSNRLGCWRIRSLLHVGRRLTTYLVSPQDNSERQRNSYVLKTLNVGMDSAEQAEAIETLATRVTIGEIVRHGGIPPVLDAELDRAPFFVVEPWVSGRALADWAGSGPHPVQAIWILRQLAEILHSAHHHDKAHLRVNPRRVLVNEMGQATLLGWGQSHTFGKKVSFEFQVADDHGWRAPETWARDYVAQPAADVYSLGLLMYWLIAGHHPLERGARTWEQTQKTQVPLWSSWPESYSGNLRLLAERMLAKNPLRRPVLSAVLNELVAGEIDHLSSAQRA